MRILLLSFVLLSLLFTCSVSLADIQSNALELKTKARFSKAWKASEQDVVYWKKRIREDHSLKANLSVIYENRADLAAILGKDDEIVLNEALKALSITPTLKPRSPMVILPRTRKAFDVARSQLVQQAESAFRKANAAAARKEYCDAWTTLAPYVEMVEEKTLAAKILNRAAIKCTNIRIPSLAFFADDPGGSDLSFLFRKPNLIVVFPLIREGAKLPDFTDSLDVTPIVRGLAQQIPKAQVRAITSSEMDRLLAKLTTQDLRRFVKIHELQLSLGDLFSKGKIEVGELDSKKTKDIGFLCKETGATALVFCRFFTGSDPETRAKLTVTVYQRDDPGTPLFMDTIKFGDFNMNEKLRVLESGVARAVNGMLQ